MTATLTPALALAYLRELSTDIRAAVVLGADGERLAGDGQLAAPARRLLAAPAAAGQGGAAASASAPPTAALAVRSEPVGDGILLAVRAADGRAIAVLAGRYALMPLLRHDLAQALEALSAGRSDPF